MLTSIGMNIRCLEHRRVLRTRTNEDWLSLSLLEGIISSGISLQEVRDMRGTEGRGYVFTLNLACIYSTERLSNCISNLAAALTARLLSSSLFGQLAPFTLSQYRQTKPICSSSFILSLANEPLLYFLR